MQAGGHRFESVHLHFGFVGGVWIRWVIGGTDAVGREYDIAGYREVERFVLRERDGPLIFDR